MLNQLTQKQKELMPIVAKRWVDWGLQTTDTPAESIVKNMQWLYEMSGLAKVPVTVCDNLHDFTENVWANVWANVGENVGENVGANVGANVWANVGANVWANVGANVWANVWANVGENVGANVWANVWANVGANVGENVWANVGANVGENVGANVGENVGAYYWADDLAFASYFEEIGILTDAKLIEQKSKYVDALKDCALGFLTDKFCIVLRKPKVYRNERGQLHREAGLAIEWNESDGFYFLDGFKIEADIYPQIISGKMKFGDIMRIENADIRAVALKYNQLSMLESGAKLIDKSARNNELYLIEDNELNSFLEEPKIWMLKMVCPTCRVFVEGVDPQFAAQYPKADHCQAYALGISPNQYRNLAVEG